MLALAQAGLQICEYTPLEVKQAITGYGSADKKQMQQMVQMILQLDRIPTPDDAADALALAICMANTSRWQTERLMIERITSTRQPKNQAHSQTG